MRGGVSVSLEEHPVPFMVHIDDDGILWFQRSSWTSISWADKRETTFQFNGTSTEVFAGTQSKYTKLTGKQVAVPSVVSVSDEDFIALKNGGKRRPMKPGQLPPGPLPQHSIRTDTYASYWGFTNPSVQRFHRADRSKDFVREGDVGPYKSGAGNLGENLLPFGAKHQMPTGGPAAFAAPDTSRGVRTIPSHPNSMNKDHMNNQAALLARGDNPAQGLAITIPQWVHMNGYTFGSHAKPGKTKGQHADYPGQSRTQWISAHPGLGLYKEFFHELRVYHEAGHLNCEVVGSYRYLYRLHMKGGNAGTHKNPLIAKLLMFYLELAAKKIPAAQLAQL